MGSNLFEKWAALFFLIAIFGLVIFLTYVPLPEQSANIILILIGGLMSSAGTALPRLFGGRYAEEKLRARVLELKQELSIVKSSCSRLEIQHTKLMSMLVERYIIKENYEIDVTEGDSNDTAQD